MEKVKINKEKILEEIGIQFEDITDLIIYLQAIVDNLESHNKNYTKSQYKNILLIRDILECLEF